MNTKLWDISSRLILLGSITYYASILLDKLLNLTYPYPTEDGTDISFWIISALYATVAFGTFIGYIIYFVGLSKLRDLVHKSDIKATEYIIMGFICIPIAFILEFSLDLIFINNHYAINIISNTFIIINTLIALFIVWGFSKLKNSSTFAIPARRGSKFIYIGLLVLVSSIAIKLLPLWGNIASLSLHILSSIYIISGWCFFRKPQTEIAEMNLR